MLYVKFIIFKKISFDIKLPVRLLSFTDNLSFKKLSNKSISFFDTDFSLILLSISLIDIIFLFFFDLILHSLISIK